MNKNRGISLITLIITIIVIIILAGAVILSLNNTNIIENANKAVESQDRTTLVDAYNLLVMDKFIASSIKNEPVGNIDINELYTKIGKDLGDKFKIEGNNLKEKQDDGSYKDIAIFPNLGNSKVERTEEEVTKDWAKTEITKAYVTNNKKIPVSTEITKNGEKKVVIPVPEGFTVSTVLGETDLGDGVVIYRGNDKVDSNNYDTALTTRDQFVWVPVDGTNIKYEKDTKWLDYIINMEDSKLAADFMGVPIEHQTQEVLEQVRQTKAMATEIKNNLALDINALPEGFKSEQNIKDSVKKYGGFYIGRYEAGSDSVDPRESSGTTDKLLVQKGKNIYNYINYNESFAKANSFVVTSNNVKCGLITGEGWDAALNFISKYENGCENYILNSTGRGNYSGSLTVAGNDNSYRCCNIYDMAGNTFEWTAETTEVQRQFWSCQ